MKFLNPISVVIIACVVLASCNSGEVRETPNGVKFTIVKKGDGVLAKPGEVVIMDMLIHDEDDSLWHDSRADVFPEMVKIMDESMKPTEHGLQETFRMISKGDSIVVKMAVKDFFPMVWNTGPPAYLDPDALMITEILCKDIMDSTAFRKYATRLDSLNKAKVAERMEQTPEPSASSPAAQLELDGQIIDAYLRSKGMTAQRMTNGLWYIMKKEGTGAVIKTGDQATMKYAGQNLDGREFDSGEYTFTVGNQEVIQGWDEIAKIMKQGTSLTVFIPSGMAYGPGGRPPVIMPNAILIFDMECIGLRRL
ncbi:MAG TPA: FKBP-type peptidyl-prolyl cis-trans isomerase [Cyclobacteriaceae bacterium]|nr:FKBP-type peptidyl-prolyl cis-trans isomerase [Cyclobacteriaceae bacterium]